MRRFGRVAVVCVLLAGAAVVVVPSSPAWAAGCVSPGSWFAGKQNPPGAATWGAGATIVARGVDQWCTSPPSILNTVSQWTALTGTWNGTGGARGIIQSGVIECNGAGCSSSVCIFGEYYSGEPGAIYHELDQCSIPITLGSSAYFYGVLFSSTACGSAGCEEMYVDAPDGEHTLGYTPFSPLGKWTAGDDAWSSETAYYDTTEPGNSTNPVAYAGLESQKPFDTVLTAPPPTPSQAATPVHPNSCVSALYLNSFTSYHTASGTCP